MIEGIDNLLNQGKVPKIPQEGGLPLIGGGATNFGQKWEVEKPYFVQEWGGMKFLPWMEEFRKNSTELGGL